MHKYHHDQLQLPSLETLAHYSNLGEIWRRVWEPKVDVHNPTARLLEEDEKVPWPCPFLVPPSFPVLPLRSFPFPALPPFHFRLPRPYPALSLCPIPFISLCSLHFLFLCPFPFLSFPCTPFYQCSQHFKHQGPAPLCIYTCIYIICVCMYVHVCVYI